jgi:hypothetical protein
MWRREASPAEGMVADRGSGAFWEMVEMTGMKEMSLQ